VAIVAHTRIKKASRTEQQAVEDRVNAAIAAQGGPPDGLMALIVYPEGDGFVICSVWADEAKMAAYDKATQRPAIEAAGLVAGQVVTAPLWSFARP
jgi:hypothetical protein